MENLHILLKCFSVAINFTGCILWIKNLLNDNNYYIFTRFMNFMVAALQLTFLIYSIILLLDKTI